MSWLRLPSAASSETIPASVRALPSELIDDLQRVQKAAQKITSILDLDQLIDSVVNEVARFFRLPGDQHLPA